MSVPSTPPQAKPVPGRSRYLIALAVFVAGMIGMVAVLFAGLSGLGDSLTQVVVPGERQMRLTPGDYTIFHEYRTVVDGKIYDVNNVSGLLTRVTDSTGKPLDLKDPTASGRYEIYGRAGVSAFTFTVTEEGDYTLDGHYRDGNGPETVLAVGKGFMQSLIGTILGSLAFAFAGAGIALFIALRTFFQRRRAAHATQVT